MDRDYIVRATNWHGDICYTPPVWQIDKGLILKIEGVPLPYFYEVHFTNTDEIPAIKMLGNLDGEVEIPYDLLQQRKTIVAYIYRMPEVDIGFTDKKIIIPVSVRATVSNVEPTPTETTIIDQAITALNEAIDDIPASINYALEEAKNSGEFDGPPGPQGEQGPQGPQGERGPKGDKGDTGPQGVQGEQGPKGDTGPQGIQGTQGPQGPKGDTGAAGPQGEKGDKGDTGSQGPQGEKGEKGDKGDTGSQGPQGAKGDTGATGAQGPKGDPGDDYILTEQDKSDIAALVEAPVQDVQVNGTSILSSGVANVPVMSTTAFGVAKVTSGRGLEINTANALQIVGADVQTIKTGTDLRKPLTPYTTDLTAFYGLARAAGDSTQSASSNSVGTYTENAKSAISQMLDAPETVSGTTPSITAKPGVRYVCGEVSTIDITLPASGCIDVVFVSGSTPTVLTVTPPTGVTVKWPDWFDPTALEANRTYEISFADGFGAVMSWT